MVHARSSHVEEVFISSSGTSLPVPSPSDADETTSRLAFGKPLSYEVPSRSSFSLPPWTLVYFVGHLVSGEDLNQIEDLLHATKIHLRTQPVLFPKTHQAVAPELVMRVTNIEDFVGVAETSYNDGKSKGFFVKVGLYHAAGHLSSLVSAASGSLKSHMTMSEIYTFLPDSEIKPSVLY